MEDFDIGPLTWVKDEIDQALSSVLENLEAVKGKPDDVSPLRFAKTHLYQVSGALDIVGIEGCKRFCSELEKLTDKLEKHAVDISSEVLDTLERSVKALMAYLQGLVDGEPDIPLKLMPMLRELAASQGENIEDSELFFPDTSLRAPKNLPSKPLDESAIGEFIANQRANYQKALLSWLKNFNPEALRLMATTVDEVFAIQQQPAQRTLWWVAGALLDALSQDSLAGDAGVKRVCRRIDQQLRSLSEGGSRASGNLLRDLLYYVATSQPATERIAQVKDVFELDRQLPAGHLPILKVTSESDVHLLEQVRELLDSVKSAWMAVSEGDATALSDFQAKLDELVACCQAFDISAANHLIEVLRALATALIGDAAPLNESVLIEVAAGITLLEDCFIDDVHHVDAETRVSTQTQRLNTLLHGEAAEGDKDGASPALGSDVYSAVGLQIKTALAGIEQALDTYFRNPEDRAPLHGLDKPMGEVTSAFDMLNLPLPLAIAHACSKVIQYFQDDEKRPETTLFDLVAESLSLLGFYVEEWPRIRPESNSSLEFALKQLNETIGRLGLDADSSLSETLLPEHASEPMPEPAATLPESGEQVVDRAIDPELLDIYLTEVEEVLKELSEHLQELERDASAHDALVEVRRGFHTLKGSGRTVGLVALGEVAWAVENLLNHIMERKGVPGEAQIAFVKQAKDAFAEWVATLRASGCVQLEPTQWSRQAEAVGDKVAPKKAARPKDEVVIGGSRKISRALFDTFMRESAQHLDALRQGLRALETNGKVLDESILRPIHTLASNAATAGFMTIGDLARALEHWLESRATGLATPEIALVDRCLDALAEMLRKAGQMRQPRPAGNLLSMLGVSSTRLGVAEPVIEVLEKNGVEAQVDVPLPGAPSIAEDIVIPVLVETQDKPEQPVQVAAQETPVSESALTELLVIFMEEAAELVPQIGHELRAWRSQPQSPSHPDALQRALHTLKGSARMAEQSALGDLVHGMESRVIQALKNKAGATDMDFEELFAELDRIGNLLEMLTGFHVGGRTLSSDTSQLAGLKGSVPNRRGQYLRLRADTLDRLINEAGEISIARSRVERELQAVKQFSFDLTESVSRLRNHLREMEIEAESQLQSRMNYLQEANEAFDPLEFDRFTRLQELTRMMAESVSDVAAIQHGLLRNLDETSAALQQQGRMNRELQHGLMSARMVPFSHITERLQRIVRQTARELQKQVELNIDGESVPIDRSVLEKMGAPLEHLLRNAIAHGIESASVRKKGRKSPIGQISLKVRLENDEIALTVSDDGGGIDLARVREKAVQGGLLNADQETGDEALLAVIFEPGFSTAYEVSQVAGRGVGLDAVRGEITSLGGRVDVASAPEKGTTFSIHLPVTLSLAQVVLIRAGSHVYALPSSMVEQVQKLKHSVLAMGYKSNNQWSGHEYPMHFFGKLIGDAELVPESLRYTPVLLLHSGVYRIALHVDEIIGNREVVLKSIGPQLARVPGMMGATIMGDGRIVLIVNPVQLANRELLTLGSFKINSMPEQESESSPLVMVVDDSLTMRKVLSRLLEREGFRVVTAKDGMDALQQLQDTVPDILLTDIEMPRMDGFELVRNLRADPATSHLPLIVISSRTAEKHRNLAQQLGVDAYLGKPVQEDALISQISQLLQHRQLPAAV
jgi:chemosensory pili system protein ChpA (sensor histidine kinase/response regulator)